MECKKCGASDSSDYRFHYGRKVQAQEKTTFTDVSTDDVPLCKACVAAHHRSQCITALAISLPLIVLGVAIFFWLISLGADFWIPPAMRGEGPRILSSGERSAQTMWAFTAFVGAVGFLFALGMVVAGIVSFVQGMQFVASTPDRRERKSEESEAGSDLALKMHRESLKQKGMTDFWKPSEFEKLSPDIIAGPSASHKDEPVP